MHLFFTIDRYSNSERGGVFEIKLDMVGFLTRTEERHGGGYEAGQVIGAGQFDR